MKQTVLLMGDEKKQWLFSGEENGARADRMLSSSLGSHHWLSVCSDKPPSGRVTDRHTHARAQCTNTLAVPWNLLSPNYSRLEPMLLSLILSVRGLWGNSDIFI